MTASDILTKDFPHLFLELMVATRFELKLALEANEAQSHLLLLLRFAKLLLPLVLLAQCAKVRVQKRQRHAGLWKMEIAIN